MRDYVVLLLCAIISNLGCVLLIHLVKEAGVILMLLQVPRRRLVRLVNLHLLHHPVSLSFVFLLLSFLLQGELPTTEFFEHILVMKNCVSKLVFKLISLQELGNTRLNLRHLKNLVNCGALSGVNLQNTLNKLSSLGKLLG